MRKALVVGTRSSKLALWQTNFVVETLHEMSPDVEFRVETFRTIGDDIVDRPLPELGGKGVFTARLESALLRGDVDLAVHSLKDLPIEMPAGLVVGAVTLRANAHDVLVTRDGSDLHSLPKGSVVGTSSLRRQAQLLAYRPDLVMRPIRGNVETRVHKVMSGEYDATVLASAGVNRLGIDLKSGALLSFDVMLPAPGQGALAVQCRSNDSHLLDMLQHIDHEDSRKAVQAERAFLTALGGGCAAPVAAFASVSNEQIRMKGLVSQPDGRHEVRLEGEGTEPVTVGRRLAIEAMAAGAGEILQSARDALENRLPLQGRRIAVTRAADQAEEICAALSGMGATPIRVPMIRTVPTIDSATVLRVVNEAREGDWVVFTSANGVSAWWSAANGSGAEKLFDKVRAAAVGSRTASALERRTVKAEFVPETFTGEAAGRGMPDVEGRSVWLLRAASGGTEIVDALSQRGARVHDIGIYRTEAVQIAPDAIQHLEKGVDAILFTSGSTVRHFAEACSQLGWPIDRFRGTTIACIGSVTRETAREIGFEVTVTPKEHTTSALVDAVADFFSEVKR